jgi:hypothetical protein
MGVASLIGPAPETRISDLESAVQGGRDPAKLIVACAVHLGLQR